MEAVDGVKVPFLKTLLLSVAIGFWLYWLWSRRHFYKFSFKFPGFLGLPIFGALLRIRHINNVISFCSKLFHDYKEYTLCIWLGLYPVVITADPEFIEQIFTSPDMFNKAHSLYQPAHEVFQGGLITSSANVWYHNRKMIQPSFNHKVLVNLLPIFNKGKNSAVKKLKPMVDNKEHKLADMLQNIALVLSVETTMGKVMQSDDQLDGDLVQKYSFMMKHAAWRIMFSFLNLGGLLTLSRRYQQTKIFLRQFVTKLIEQKLAKLKAPSVAYNYKTNQEESNEELISLKKIPNIFIDQAIQIYQKQQFSMLDMTSESNTIMASSFETTANAVFSVLVMLAMHHDAQERLYEELASVFPEKRFELEYKDMEHLPYLDMVIKETLRLAPPVPMIGRHTVKDTPLGNDLILPKNLQIFILIFQLHRRTDIWGPNANDFDPDNFLPQNMDGKHSYAYMPFSKGSRNCIAWRYALFSIKTMVAGLIRNYRFTTSFKYDDLKFVNYIVFKYLNEPGLKIIHRQ